MKITLESQTKIREIGRWDIDFHLPPEEIIKFNELLIKNVSDVASVVKEKRDPTKKPEDTFLYIDISCVDITSGTIVSPQELTGEEAPSRARKVVLEDDIIISTCRPTRGAIAIVPAELDNQIASTGFSVIRCKKDKINPIYLQFVLKMESTLEQFRKFSTGSSYPAILDSDVLKTKIPVPSIDLQNEIADFIVSSKNKRENTIKSANESYYNSLSLAQNSLNLGVLIK
ncbi:Type I restriction modification DNA specificity domain [Yersinia aldovae]|uniref:restriction endonuclease subunit S n=1 Tax=Yersinia aldovae TaxID=29483 RepID=UPI0005E6A290|nr:restriction endonuclease subunit S [Yersinia aldovae]CNH84984.1 Type I restriction modification DNA specificity domain [Yersinia aldovae]